MTGENLEYLYKFLNAVPPIQTHLSLDSLEQEFAEFQVDELFNVPEVGTVLGGILKRGVLQVHDSVLVGPNESGEFHETRVSTIRRNRTPCRLVKAGQAATVTVTITEHPDFRKVNWHSCMRQEMSHTCTTHDRKCLALAHTTGNGTPFTPNNTEQVVQQLLRVYCRPVHSEQHRGRTEERIPGNNIRSQFQAKCLHQWHTRKSE